MTAAAPARLVFATRNAGKVAELRALLGDGGVEVLSERELGLEQVPEVVEDGETFEANAAKKALAFARATGLPALADDSGLCVDALGGAPGVHSARYAEGDDAARVEKLLVELARPERAGRPRSAHFVCVLCLAFPDGRTVFARGESHGVIAQATSGQGGFGYDPVFLVPELGKTFAELSREEKSARSHRGAAFRRLRPDLLALAPPNAR